ncbi:MAG: hypothetical protein AAF236_13015, partial [Verrucomicrobiota bacterium]
LTVLPSTEAFFTEFGKKPKAPSDSDEMAPASGVAGTYSDNEGTALLADLRKLVGKEFVETPVYDFESTLPALIQIEKMRWGVIPTFTKSETSFALYLPAHGTALDSSEGRPTPDATVALGSGDSALYIKQLDEQSLRAVVFTRVEAPKQGSPPAKPKREGAGKPERGAKPKPEAGDEPDTPREKPEPEEESKPKPEPAEEEEPEATDPKPMRGDERKPKGKGGKGAETDVE